jgi:hypothetical protein
MNQKDINQKEKQQYVMIIVIGIIIAINFFLGS